MLLKKITKINFENNAYKTAEKYTWDKRCQKIIDFFEKKCDFNNKFNN